MNVVWKSEDFETLLEEIKVGSKADKGSQLARIAELAQEVLYLRSEIPDEDEQQEEIDVLRETLVEVRKQILRGDSEYAIELIGREIGY